MLNSDYLRLSKRWYRIIHKRILRLTRCFRRPPLARQLSATALLLFFITVLHLSWAYLFAKPNLSTPPTIASAHRIDLFDSNQQLEKTLARSHVCRTSPLSNNLHELRLCGQFPPSSTNKKIVALVEIRNVALTITAFLNALSKTVDSVILIDDHSTDSSRANILVYNHNLANSPSLNRSSPLVEALLNKTGPWQREELADRESLLLAGRRAKATHFVLLDYDEYFSSNCVRSGLLRRSILRLVPGQSLFLPWVELWKNPSLHRVVPRDPSMNFLRRRQVVIFADDNIAHYNIHNSQSRMLRNGSIHTLRCPRSICGKPPPYLGPGWMRRPWRHTTILPSCAVVEMRFLSLPNVLLKSAWYEALGRVMGARDGVTAGKMVDLVFPPQDGHLPDADPTGQKDGFFALSSTPREWVDGLDEEIINKHRVVELWRARELLQWVDEHGLRFFSDLRLVPSIDLPRLQTVIDEVRLRDNVLLRHIPRQLKGTFIVAFENPSIPMLSAALRKFNILQIDFPAHLRDFSRLLNVSNPSVRVERWKAAVAGAVHDAVLKSTGNISFISADCTQTEHASAILDLVRDELSQLDVILIFGSAHSSTASALLSTAAAMSLELGSHVTCLDIPLPRLGSFHTLFWLRDRLGLGRLANTSSTNSQADSALLAHAEAMHQEFATSNLVLAPTARLIFSLNVGRCGSKYLADVLGTANEPIEAVHEPRCPDGACSGGGALRMQDRRLKESYEARKAVKLPMIRAGVVRAVGSVQVERDTVECTTKRRVHGDEDGVLEIGSQDGCNVIIVARDVVYAETNPNFKGWFYDVVLEELPSRGYAISVLVVRKHIAAVVKSLFETGYFSTRDGYTWMETAAGVNSRVHEAWLKDDGKLDAVDRIMSYVVNAEAVFEEVQSKYDETRTDGRVRFVDVRAEDMFGVDGTHKVFWELRLRPSRRTEVLARQRLDKYGEGERKQRVGHLRLEESEKRARRFVERSGGPERRVGRLLKGWVRKDGFRYRE